MFKVGKGKEFQYDVTVYSTAIPYSGEKHVLLSATNPAANFMIPYLRSGRSTYKENI